MLTLSPLAEDFPDNIQFIITNLNYNNNNMLAEKSAYHHGEISWVKRLFEWHKIL